LAKLEKLSERDSDNKVRYLTDDERKRLLAALDAREQDMRDGRDNHILWSKSRKLPLAPVMKDTEFADHLKPIILLSLSTGIRRNAMFSLEWRDVNFTDKTIMARAATSKNDRLVLRANE
jgi:integrase